MKIAFIVTSFWSYGELLIAMQFASKLRDDGKDVLFIIPSSHSDNVKKQGFRYITLIPKSRKFNQILFSEISNSFKPDLVILSDFLNYNFAFKHYGVIKDDLELLKCKIATFDNFDWELNRKCMDTYGLVSNVPNQVNIEDYGYKIKPCPIVNSFIPDENDSFRYSVINSLLDISTKNKIEKRLKYGFNEDDKIILVSYANWQENHIKEPSVDFFISKSNLLFEELIINLAKDYKVICVGKKDTRIANHKNIHCYSSMTTDKFDDFSIISDLYLGRNITSTSMIKIALSGITCVNLVNSITSIEDIKENEFGKFNVIQEFNNIKMYKYRMFPVGWYYFLDPVLKNNLYNDTIIIREQFEMNETLKVITNLLSSKENKNNLSNNVKKYSKILNDLPTPSKIVEYILKEK